MRLQLTQARVAAKGFRQDRLEKWLRASVLIKSAQLTDFQRRLKMNAFKVGDRVRRSKALHADNRNAESMVVDAHRPGPDSHPHLTIDEVQFEFGRERSSPIRSSRYRMV